MSRKSILWIGQAEVPSAVSALSKHIGRSARSAPGILVIDARTDFDFIAEALTPLGGFVSQTQTLLYAPSGCHAADVVQIINAWPVTLLVSEPDELAGVLSGLIAQNNIHRSQYEVESKVAKIRALIRFVKDLSSVLSLEDLMHLLRHEIRSFTPIKDPILATLGPSREARLHYFQGQQVLSKSVGGRWPSFQRPRLNDKEDSQYLANIFGRPFARLIAIPVELSTQTSNASAALFFEHAFNQQQLQSFVEFIELRLQALSVALDRLFLEIDLKDASLLWERTFDGIKDPVAIFDFERHLLRANRAFSEKFSDISPDALHSTTVRFNDGIYENLSYPIALVKGEQPTNVVNHYVDVTLAHRLQQQMIQNEKMAAIGHLAGHIAHELNNPLTGIRSLAQVLLQQVESGTNTYSDLIEVEKAAERCQLIIRNLLEFSSGGVKNRQRISLNEIVQRTLPLLKTAMSPFRQELQLAKDEIYVDVEPQLMQQVFFNLVKNACQAMGETGTLTINGRLAEDGYAELSVKDSGVGMSEETLKNIFDFFFTTKTQGQGTGLGLSMSKSIVDQFGGEISVRSQFGQGSEFIVRLPAVVKERT